MKPYLLRNVDSRDFLGLEDIRVVKLNLFSDEINKYEYPFHICTCKNTWLDPNFHIAPFYMCDGQSSCWACQHHISDLFGFKQLRVCFHIISPAAQPHWNNQWYFLFWSSHSGLPTFPYFLSSVYRSHTIQKHRSPKSGHHKLCLWQSTIWAVAQISILTQFFWYTKYYIICRNMTNYIIIFIILNNNNSGGSAIHTDLYCVFFNNVNMNIWADSDDVTFSQPLLLLELLPFQVQEFQCISCEQFILHKKSTNHIKYWTDIISVLRIWNSFI